MGLVPVQPHLPLMTDLGGGYVYLVIQGVT